MKAPDGAFEVVIEVPRGSRNKYEINHDTGEVWLDRTLFTATHYPYNYGFFEHTLGEDGDPLDALVLGDEPMFPGTHLWARPVAAVLMADEAGQDAKVVCVPVDHRWNDVKDLDDIATARRDEIQHFFQEYKALEPGKHSMVRGWVEVAAAVDLVRAAQARLTRD